MSERAYIDTVTTQLYELVRCQTQANQQLLSLQMKAAETKRMKDLAMLLQTKDMIQTSQVLLLSMKDYKGDYLIADNIPFSTAILNLTERPGASSIVNQVNQITRNYNCSPHLPLWLKLVKVNGFLAPTGFWYGGFHLGFSVPDSQQSQKIKTSYGSRRRPTWREKGKCLSRTLINSSAVHPMLSQR